MKTGCGISFSGEEGGTPTIVTRAQSLLQCQGNGCNDPWCVMVAREQGWWMARESGAVGSQMHCLGSGSQSVAKFAGGKQPLPSWSWAPSNPLSSPSPFPSPLSLLYVSPALGSALCLIKQPQKLKTQCLFYFIFLHTCITPRQATPGIGLFVWFYFVAFRGKKKRREGITQTTQP